MRGCRHGVVLCGLLFALNAFAATPPAITSQPASKTVLSGSNATFSVAASTGTTLSYQWYFNSVLIKGATNNSYAVVKAQFTNAGPYYVNVINAGGTVKSAVATLNVNPPAGSTLAAPWVSADVGTVGLVGSAYNAGGVMSCRFVAGKVLKPEIRLVWKLDETWQSGSIFERHWNQKSFVQTADGT